MLQELQKFYKRIKKAMSEQKWCGVCNKYNHNQVDCYYKPTGASLFRGHCFRCGEQGYRGRACNQEMMATHAEIDQAKNEKPKHRMLAVTFGDSAYDEDMWMICTTTSNHMTPYAKFFSTLDNVQSPGWIGERKRYHGRRERRCDDHDEWSEEDNQECAFRSRDGQKRVECWSDDTKRLLSRNRRW